MPAPESLSWPPGPWQSAKIAGEIDGSDSRVLPDVVHLVQAPSLGEEGSDG